MVGPGEYSPCLGGVFELVRGGEGRKGSRRQRESSVSATRVASTRRVTPCAFECHGDAGWAGEGQWHRRRATGHSGGDVQRGAVRMEARPADLDNVQREGEGQ